MTRIEFAKRGIITQEMEQVALSENIHPDRLASDIANGHTVITRNVLHKINPVGIGKGLRTKINANIGTSKDKVSLEKELQKLDILIKYGADAVMDLSTGGAIKDIRRLLMARSTIAVGTVPIYEAAVKAVERSNRISEMTEEDIFETIEEHAQDGVDFITVHCGVTRKAIERLKLEGRKLDVVSRGGAFLIEWMILNDKENPLYEKFDRVLEIAKKYDLTLSLGDGFRPGCIEDSTDRCQIEELVTLSELRDIALDAGVQVIIEGPGHVPLDQIELNIKLQKELCKGAPFYV
ncbi:MAG: phosphomethylpyrimidine synthase ThiC, partial [Thermodesulfovibrionales bacterium]|nr:phosphomethylpyrimidine synthase ThiC [Thermodesulfovibrionales bacterium]